MAGGVLYYAWAPAERVIVGNLHYTSDAMPQLPRRVAAMAATLWLWRNGGRRDVAGATASTADRRAPATDDFDGRHR